VKIIPTGIQGLVLFGSNEAGPETYDNPNPSTWLVDKAGHVVVAGIRYCAMYDGEGNLVQVSTGDWMFQRKGDTVIESKWNKCWDTVRISKNVTDFRAEEFIQPLQKAGGYRAGIVLTIETKDRGTASDRCYIYDSTSDKTVSGHQSSITCPQPIVASHTTAGAATIWL
jgi:hypothetical protein